MGSGKAPSNRPISRLGGDRMLDVYLRYGGDYSFPTPRGNSSQLSFTIVFTTVGMTLWPMGDRITPNLPYYKSVYSIRPVFPSGSWG
jgi:hypothetical protein